MNTLDALKKAVELSFAPRKKSCEHNEHKRGVCVECNEPCPHWEWESGNCPTCGEWIEPNDPRSEPEYAEER